MILQLEAKTEEQKLIKAYLENNADERLAYKINHGTKTNKDGKTLINKKDLDGFMNYAESEAKKLVVKGAHSACVRSDVVFGWAMHYFDEDEILGILHNTDGSEYKPVKPKPQPSIKPSTPAIPHTPPKPKEEQASFFDLFSTTPKDEKQTEDEEPTMEDLQEAMDELIKFNETDYVDKNGEIHSSVPETNEENPLKQALFNIFGEIIIER